jgi:citrate lyase subunit beta / citryl-CoA lyase
MDRPLLRSMLFVPGDQPRMLAKAPTLDADAVILDLEDGVAAKDKEAARAGLETALRGGMTVGGTLWVRPNGLHTGLLEDDLAACLWPGVAGVVVAKARAATEVRVIDGIVDRLSRDRGLGPMSLAVLIETPPAVLAAADIGRACSYLAALMFGADDLAAEMGLTRTEGNDEVGVPRAQVALTAHALQCEAIDIVYTQIRDEEGFRRECADGRRLGYTGKQVIHPAQIAPANAAFSPGADELAWATRIVEAYHAAPRGALVVDGRMVDAPIVAQARRLLERARRGAAAP